MSRKPFTRLTRALAVWLVAVALLVPTYTVPQLTPKAQAASGDCARYVADINYPDYSYVPRNTWITKRWRMFNCGTTNLYGYTVLKQWGVLGPYSFTINKSAPPGYNFEVYAYFNTGNTVGTFQSTYSLYNGGYFGDPFYFILNVY